MVCHDLAASFRHLTHFSRLLLDERGEELTERELIHAEQLRAAGVRCEAMLEQLFVYSRIQQKTLEKVRRDATPIVHLSVLRLAEPIKAAGAEISVDPLGEVYADEELLALACGAVLDNAIKFARSAAPLRIAVRSVGDDTASRIRISDNGPGVAPKYRDIAFQMFRRLNRQNADPGVGAGLAIARRIARRHGGEAAFLDGAEGACVELAFPHAPVSTLTRYVQGT
jgi:signal transduction histidine kinase